MVKALILTTCNLMLTVINNQGYSHRGWKLNLIKVQVLFFSDMFLEHPIEIKSHDVNCIAEVTRCYV